MRKVIHCRSSVSVIYSCSPSISFHIVQMGKGGRNRRGRYDALLAQQDQLQSCQSPDEKAFDNVVNSAEPESAGVTVKDDSEKSRRPSRSEEGPSIELLAEVFLFFPALFILIYTMNMHYDLHEMNECEMTYIYRPMIFNPIDVPYNNVPHYTLLRYMEGYHDSSLQSIDVPVLFIPGSGGSGKQVRSIATTATNITNRDYRNKHRFVFFATDFDEEFTFLTGAALYRQREFVVQTIATILEMYKRHGIEKLILIGHSFGGTIIHSLPAHDGVNMKIIDTMITLGAPLFRPPFNTDGLMLDFYNQTYEAWRNRSNELTHISFVSYSGGLKDYLVPDHLARGMIKMEWDFDKMTLESPFIVHHDERIIHYPSWSLRDVATESDHNCLVWCNQLVRHVSSLLIAHGRNWMRRGKDKYLSRQVTAMFYNKYTEPQYNKDELFRDKRSLFNNSIGWFTPIDKRRLKFNEKKRHWLMKINCDVQDAIFHIRIKPIECPEGIQGATANITFRSAENFTIYSKEEGNISMIRVNMIYPESQRLKGDFVLSGSIGCSYEMEATVDWQMIYYQRLLDSTLLPLVFFFSLLLSAFIPILLDIRPVIAFNNFINQYPMILLNVKVILIGVIFISIHRWTSVYLLVFLFARGTTFMIAMPLQPIIRRISMIIEGLPRLVRVISRNIIVCLLLLLTQYNMYYAYAATLSLFTFKVGPHSKFGLVMILFTCSLLIAVGSARPLAAFGKNLIDYGLMNISPSNPVEIYNFVCDCIMKHCHPLLLSLLPLIFMFFFDLATSIDGDEDNVMNVKEVTFALVVFLCSLSVLKKGTVDAMAQASAHFVCLFEFFKAKHGMKARDALILS